MNMCTCVHALCALRHKWSSMALISGWAKAHQKVANMQGSTWGAHT